MRMLTHVVFGAGFTAALFTFGPAYVRIYLAIVLSVLVNPLIDWAGHYRKGPYISRSPLTHSVFTAPAWGAAVGFLLWYGLTGFGGFPWPSELLMVEMGVAMALAHLGLDAVTERGVFLLTGRIAFAHFRSNNSLLNGLFVAIGVGLFFV